MLSPSFTAPAVASVVHDQAMARLEHLTGLVPVEFTTTRQLGATASNRARDLNEAFAYPAIRAILTTVGGEDLITVIPHLDPDLVRSDPKPFLETNDNTNVHTLLWTHGVASIYGGSFQVHLGPGPAVDDIHARSLLAALMTGETLDITDPGESEDFGRDWNDPRALLETGEREPTQDWVWAGPAGS